MSKPHNDGSAMTRPGFGGSMSRSSDDVINALAEQQHGLVARSQLLGAGMTPDMVRARVDAKRLRPVQRGVYLVGPAVAPHLREMAAVLACGEGAVVSHRSAAALWELLPHPGPSASVDILVPMPDRGRRPGIRAHHTSRLQESEVTTWNRIPVTTPARTVLDLAGEVQRRELERVVAKTEREGLAAPGEISQLIARHPRRPGVGILRALLSGHASPTLTRSHAEERFLALVRKAQLAMPEVNVGVGGYEVDFLWRPQRLVVEVDGFAFHSSRREFKRDRRRDSILSLKGLRVLRITWGQIVEEPEAVVALVAHNLAIAGPR
jgi:very-short-patch-repair endonuclease